VTQFARDQQQLPAMVGFVGQRVPAEQNHVARYRTVDERPRDAGEVTAVLEAGLK